MTETDSRFYGLLALVFGPLFIVGGWLAAFTDVGAGLIVAGTAMLVVAPLLRRSLGVALTSVAVLAGVWIAPLIVS